MNHGVFFLRARAIGDKELLAQVQSLPLHCSGIKPIAYRSQESISVPLIFCRVPCVINRSRIELIERYFRVPIELRDRIRDHAPGGHVPPSDENSPGVPGFRTWRAAYWFVFASFVAVVVALTIFSRVYA